ncbi:hypothetical protein PINS_up024113 [Pythium insidiosum]|nr:hypothetical protein PINS_up024113 [Pythium insidiosum]
MRRHRASPPALVVSVAADLVGSGVRHRARRPLWCALVLLHGVCTAFPCAVGLVYLALPRHGTTVLYNAEMYDVSVSRRYFKTIAVVYFLVAGLHAAHLLQIIATSLRYRSLLLEAPEQQRLRRASAGSGRLNLRRLISGWTARAAVRTGPAFPRITEPQRGSVDSPSVVQDSGRRSSSSVGRLVALWSALDIMDPNYDTTNLLREVVETVVLTVQAYRASYLVPRPWVNNTLVALLVLNCWSVPIVQGFFGAKVLRARLVGLLINTVLDVVYYIVVPTVLFLPYYREFDVSWSGFHPRCWFSSRWLISAITEWQMLFVTCGLGRRFQALHRAQHLPRAAHDHWIGATAREKCPRDDVDNASVLPQPILMPRRRQDACKTGAKSPKNKRAAVPRNIRATATPIARDVAPVKRLRGFVVRQLHHALIVWGRRCTREPSPCGVASPQRAVRDAIAPVVCASGDMFAHDSRLPRDCRQHRDRRRRRVLTACSRPSTRAGSRRSRSATARTSRSRRRSSRLHALMGFKIFNSTLMRWDDDAALSRKHHPQAKVVHLLQTSMGGAACGSLRSRVSAVAARHRDSRVQRDASAAGGRGRVGRVTLLKLEGLAFADGHVPEALTRLRPTFLALSLNGLTSLPRELMENPRLSALSICANPISELPEEVRVVPPLSLLLVDWTNVSELPSWVETRFLVGSGSNSPLCQTLVTLQADQVAMDERLSQLQQRIYCKPFDGDPRWLFQYPLLAESFFNP